MEFSKCKAILDIGYSDFTPIQLNGYVLNYQTREFEHLGFDYPPEVEEALVKAIQTEISKELVCKMFRLGASVSSRLVGEISHPDSDIYPFTSS